MASDALDRLRQQVEANDRELLELVKALAGEVAAIKGGRATGAEEGPAPVADDVVVAVRWEAPREAPA